MDVYELKEQILFEQLPTEEKIDYLSAIAIESLKYWNIPEDSIANI